MNEMILVIDDEPLILTTIERALLKVGYDVKTTSTLNDFMFSLKKNTFDLLIMDLHIGGIKPDELLKEVRMLAPQSKILIVSGSAYPFEKNFIQKPFKIDELRERVRDLLDKPV